MTADIRVHPVIQRQAAAHENAIRFFDLMARDYERVGELETAHNMRQQQQDRRTRLAQLEQRMMPIRLPACPA